MPTNDRKRRLRTGSNNGNNNHHRSNNNMIVQPQTFPVVQNSNNNNSNNNEIVMIHLVPLTQVAGQQQQQQQRQQQEEEVPQLTQTAEFFQAAPLATAAATAFEYSAVLCLTLAAWLVYLLLPKGFRKAYCRANRRRYPRHVSSTTRRVAAAWGAAAAAATTTTDPRNDVSLNTSTNASSSYYAGSSSQLTPSSEYYTTTTTTSNSGNTNSEYNNPTTASYNPSEEDQIIFEDDETTTTATDDKGSFASVQDSVLQEHVQQQLQQQQQQQQQQNRRRIPVTSSTRESISSFRYNTPQHYHEQARDDDEDKDSYAQQQQPFPSSNQRRTIFAPATTPTPTLRFGWSSKKSGDVAEQFASFFPNNNNNLASNGSSSICRTPSLSHPAIPHLPDPSILQETMRRLTDRGVRLMAHGVTCAPKRVWIRLDLSDPTARNLEWQTEVPRSIPNQSGATSIVLMRGAKHIIPLPNILYVDVGKKTSALQKADNKHIPATACFSLLTQTGSLDLQTNSKLERDAVVSCMSMVLDYVHPEHDWRMLYEQTPPASIATTTGGSSVGAGASALSNISSNVFPQATTADI